MLLQIATPDGNAYVFDLKKEPKMMHDGCLWRILVAPAIHKVMHDCRYVSKALKKQYDVTLQNVFDTQVHRVLLLIHFHILVLYNMLF